MKIIYYANACCVYESAGFRLLCDPWIIGSPFEGSWAHFPPLRTKPDDIKGVNALYISHLHPDHFDQKSLAKIRKDIPVVYLDKAPNFLEKKIREAGFTKLIPIKNSDSLQIGPFKLTMFGPFTGNLFHESDIGNLIDSALVIEADKFKVLNGNDNSLTIDAAKMLHERFGKFDVVQLVDSCAGPYPACFQNLSHQEKLKEKNRVLKRHLDLTLECARILEAKHIQPFAGHYVLKGRLSSLNLYIPVYTVKEVAEFIKEAGLKPLEMHELDQFNLENERLFSQGQNYVNRETWQETHKHDPYTYDLITPANNDQLIELCGLALTRMRDKQSKMDCWIPWTFSMKCTDGFEWNNQFGPLEAGGAEGNISFTMERRALTALLMRKCHFNNLEVGCHININRYPNVYIPDIHTLMSFFHS